MSAPLPYMLPAIMKVGELYQTENARRVPGKSLPYDLRVLSVLHADTVTGGIVATSEIDLTTGRIEIPNRRIIVVYEYLDFGGSGEWVPAAKVVGLFVQRMMDMRPIKYERPNVEEMVRSVLYSANKNMRANVLFLSSEALELLREQAKKRQKLTDNDELFADLPTRPTYDGYPIYEVATEGIHVWGGAENNG